MEVNNILNSIYDWAPSIAEGLELDPPGKFLVDALVDFVAERWAEKLGPDDVEAWKKFYDANHKMAQGAIVAVVTLMQEVGKGGFPILSNPEWLFDKALKH